MGILQEGIDLLNALELKPGFSVCELGDQYITTDGKENQYLADEWYRLAGCSRYESVDGNGNGTVVWDLNELMDNGVPKGMWLDQFDLVTDFGTGEHVFDQRAVWENLHNLAKHGGIIVFERPCAGFDGHGFYLTDPSLIFDLAQHNRYQIIVMSREDRSRGNTIMGALRVPRRKKAFVVPQQGRYHKDLGAILTHEHASQPAHKNPSINLVRKNFL